MLVAGPSKTLSAKFCGSVHSRSRRTETRNKKSSSGRTRKTIRRGGGGGGGTAA
jgi:hypothetical protein